MIVSIEPHTLSQQFTTVQISLPYFSFQTPVYANVLFRNPDETGPFSCSCRNKTVEIPADIYAQWGTDDQYIINYVLGQLGLTQAQPEPE